MPHLHVGWILAARQTHALLAHAYSDWSSIQTRHLPSVPCGQLRLSSSMSAPLASAILASCVQSASSSEHMIDAMMTWLGKSRLSSCVALQEAQKRHNDQQNLKSNSIQFTLHQYMAVFSEINSMLRKEPCWGPNEWPLVVPRTMRGEMLVTASYNQ